ncbi:MAG: GLPGLI family protein [Flavobacterium sp.]|jgi:GLPGLI family protein|uniref:GLPGLI family protein n=1 Tax=Flavobacterium TaxID=237 RepID=UPI0022CA98DD|nr:GLPGLI family protein [Flavobacterium sp.]MCZ8089936.1 GLPGLI family protein [Flavobacterium sp.]MCZ8331161.1 GLPGLI family protein [Flavobacterium sp.]
MTKVVLISSFLLMGFLAKAQEFQGKAEYFSKMIYKNGIEEVGVKSDDDENLKKAYEEALKNASEKAYTLTFTKTEALFEKNQSLEKPSSQNNGVSVSIHISGEGKKYLNTKERTRIVEDDILGKEFLIVEKLQQFDWKLLNETKKIGDYTCYKAEVTIPVTEKEKKQYEEYLKKQESKPSFFTMDEPKEKKVTAWYTPDIPVNVGPLNYWGLPGLILEIQEEKRIILCSKVVISNKENFKIKVPNVGVEVSQEEFDAIHKDKMESLERR